MYIETSDTLWINEFQMSRAMSIIYPLEQL